MRTFPRASHRMRSEPCSRRWSRSAFSKECRFPSGMRRAGGILPPSPDGRFENATLLATVTETVIHYDPWWNIAVRIRRETRLPHARTSRSLSISSPDSGPSKSASVFRKTEVPVRRETTEVMPPTRPTGLPLRGFATITLPSERSFSKLSPD